MMQNRRTLKHAHTNCDGLDLDVIWIHYLCPQTYPLLAKVGWVWVQSGSCGDQQAALHRGLVEPHSPPQKSTGFCLKSTGTQSTEVSRVASLRKGPCKVWCWFPFNSCLFTATASPLKACQCQDCKKAVARLSSDSFEIMAW